MSKTTPTQRTLALLKKQGMTAGIVEKWIQFGPKDPRRAWAPGQRQDYLGIIDIIAVDSENTWGIQCCAGSGFSSHYQKLMDSETTWKWLSCPHRKLFIYAWRKLKKVRGGKAMKWEPRIEEIKR